MNDTQMENMQIEKLLQECPLKKEEVFDYILNKGLLADTEERAKKRVAVAFNRLYKEFIAEQKPTNELVQEYQEAINELLLLQQSGSGIDALL